MRQAAGCLALIGLFAVGTVVVGLLIGALSLPFSLIDNGWVGLILALVVFYFIGKVVSGR